MVEQMAALIRGCLCCEIEDFKGTDEEIEDQLVKAWIQTKYYLEIVHQVKFT
jgi:hypothetical protein